MTLSTNLAKQQKCMAKRRKAKAGRCKTMRSNAPVHEDLLAQGEVEQASRSTGEAERQDDEARRDEKPNKWPSEAHGLASWAKR